MAVTTSLLPKPLGATRISYIFHIKLKIHTNAYQVNYFHYFLLNLVQLRENDQGIRKLSHFCDKINGSAILDSEVTSLSPNLGKMGQNSDLLNYIRQKHKNMHAD